MQPNNKTMRQPEVVDQAMGSAELADFVPKDGARTIRISARADESEADALVRSDDREPAS